MDMDHLAPPDRRSGPAYHHAVFDHLGVGLEIGQRSLVTEGYRLQRVQLRFAVAVHVDDSAAPGGDVMHGDRDVVALRVGEEVGSTRRR